VISYLQLGHVFTANMTGNTVLLGLALGGFNVSASLRSTAALAGFIIGVAFGAVAVGRGRKRREWPPSVTLALAIECAIMVTFGVAFVEMGEGILTTGGLFLLIFLLGSTMGIQSAATRHLDVGGIATTYMTGTLTNFVIGIIGWAGPADLPSATIHGPSVSARRLSVELLGKVYLIYFGSAIVAGLLEHLSPRFVIFLPSLILSAIVVVALIYHFH
jgi:uncharacterized membrane protein YoaK (UPF0700 family)